MICFLGVRVYLISLRNKSILMNRFENYQYIYKDAETNTIFVRLMICDASYFIAKGLKNMDLFSTPFI